MSRFRLLASVAAMAVVVPLGITGLATPAVAADAGLARSPEASTTTRLADRRSIVVGDRMYEVGAEDGSYPATGWHIHGEMGGFWTQPIKVLDGVWFNVNDHWLTATRYSNGYGYARMDFGSVGGVTVSRTDFAPDGVRAGLIGLTITSRNARSVSLTVDAHSELMQSYPWGWTTPSASVYNLPDTGSYDGSNLVFREAGYPAGGQCRAARLGGAGRVDAAAGQPRVGPRLPWSAGSGGDLPGGRAGPGPLRRHPNRQGHRRPAALRGPGAG
jgi:hypothetical protein